MSNEIYIDFENVLSFEILSVKNIDYVKECIDDLIEWEERDSNDPWAHQYDGFYYDWIEENKPLFRLPFPTINLEIPVKDIVDHFKNFGFSIADKLLFDYDDYKASFEKKFKNTIVIGKDYNSQGSDTGTICTTPENGIAKYIWINDWRDHSKFNEALKVFTIEHNLILVCWKYHEFYDLSNPKEFEKWNVYDE